MYRATILAYLTNMKKIILFVLLLCAVQHLFAQQLLNQDLSTINVDQLSDTEILYYYNKLQQNHITPDQAEQIAAAKGMPQDQIQKLHDRLQTLLQKNPGLNSNVSPSPQTDSSATSRKVMNSDTMVTATEKIEKKIFGSELFSKSSLSFQPNLRIPTPVNYQIGPDDELNIDVFGYSEAHYKLTVSPEGTIYIPNAGPIFVSGLTMQQAYLKIKSKLAATIYKAIGSGKTDVEVTLGNIKSIRVTVIGESKRPGTYTVSSLSTVFNALYVCGGPNINGSYRNVALLRDNKVIRKIDLYDFLLSGDQTNNIGLRDGDVIRIPFYTSRVTLTGEVKRPGIYELIPGVTLQQVLDYAGGFTDSAYRADIKIIQLTERDRKVKDIAGSDLGNYLPESGDQISVGKILDRFENRVQIEGAVQRPGEFELTQGLTLKQLIEKADGLKEDAFTPRGIISRMKADLTPEIISFNILNVINNPQDDILLKKNDIIHISSIFDLKDSTFLNIEGEVRHVGNYRFKEGMTLKDLIFEAGGFTEAATGKRIEIARRVINSDAGGNSTETAQIILANSEKDLQLSNNQVMLEPYDVVIVRNNPGYFVQKTVTVSGEVMYPGQYIIDSTDEKISSLIARAGGLKSTADASAASLRRLNLLSDLSSQIKQENIAKLADLKSTDSSNAAADSLSKEAVKPYDLIGINLNEVITNPGITNDLILENGDMLFVPKKNQAVKVRGEVLFPTQFAFEQNRNMKYYIDRAGGFSSNALKRKSFVLGSNGNARKVSSFLFLKKYPDIYAGDEIFVPKIPERRALSTGEVVGISSAVISLASVIIALFNNLKL